MKGLSLMARNVRGVCRIGRAHIAAVLSAGLAFLVLWGEPAHALPSYAAQTGQPCTSCHVGGFGPQLIPLGRAFKIGGYTQSGGEGWRAQVPFAAMTIGSFTHTDTNQPSHSLPGIATTTTSISIW